MKMSATLVEQTVIVGNEEIATWPEYCPRKHMKCYQCYLEGKFQCARQGMTILPEPARKGALRT